MQVLIDGYNGILIIESDARKRCAQYGEFESKKGASPQAT